MKDYEMIDTSNNSNYKVIDVNDERYIKFGKTSSSQNQKQPNLKEKMDHFEETRKNQTKFQQDYQEKCDSQDGRRGLYQSDSQCPEGELYIRWIHQGAGNAVETRTTDMRVRDVDKAQFYTGVFVKTTAITECFFARLDRVGNIVAMSYLMNSNVQNEATYCYSLTLTENNDWIAVGQAFNGLGRYSALIVMLDDDLVNTPVIKMWSNSISTIDGSSPNQLATDVATTSDGGIFVTGFLSNAWTLGGYDCFVLRLNYTLQVVYAKSFGTSTDNELCYSIQVTRNYDYIYLGGIKYLTTGSTYREMIFFKFDAYLDKGMATSLIPTTNSDQLSLKRIMLTQKQTYSSTNDNNVLYFCGATDNANGDIIVGTVTSTAISTATTPVVQSMTVSQVFRYGSVHYEALANCVLTEDNTHILVLFNTRHYTNYEGYTGTYGPIPTGYTYNSPNAVNAVLNDPYFGSSCLSCTRRSVYNLIPEWHSSIQDYCENSAYNQITSYAADYASKVYTWTTCDYYIFDFNSLDCSIYDVDFSDCSATSGTLGSYVRHYQNIAGTWFSNDEDCEWPLSSINTFKPWYNTNYSPSYCRNDRFKINTWENIFGNITSTTTRNTNFYPYMFCIQNDGTQTNNQCNWDDFEFLYEQDCTGDTNKGNFDNWFIIKIEIATFTATATNINNFPLEAAYFGDRDGHVTGYTLAVDSAGFIYLSGTSDAARLGAVGTEKIWIYAKTHWRMTFESRYQQTSTTYNSRSQYLNKRFVKPKKSKNIDSPTDPASGVSYTFTRNFLLEASLGSYNISGGNTQFYSYPINEVDTSLFIVHSYLSTFQTDKGLSANEMADSFVSMNFFPPIRVAKSSSYTQYIALPQSCQMSDLQNGPVSNTYRNLFNLRMFQSGSGAGGLSFSTLTTDASAQNYLSGAVTVSEGIYYTWYQGNSNTFGIYQETTPGYPDYACNSSKYGYFHDSHTYNSLRRYEYSVRLKIIVDDPQLPPPENKMNIPDITPTCGQRYEITAINNYFTTSCSYMKVKQNKVLTATTGTSMNSTQLPNWIMFYEQNYTFEMYPINTGKVYIDVFCYNAIDEYVVNTFSIDPQDTTPTNAFGTGVTPYTIQYDSYEGVGQYFYWAKTIAYYYDTDTTSDTYDTLYKHTNHTVLLTFIPTYINAFNQIGQMGLLFGQASKTTLNNIGTKTFTYEYKDRHTLIVPQATFSIVINQQPEPTATGIAYSFTSIDPTTGQPTTYFDDLFPWVKDDYSNMLEILTAAWFTDKDSDTLTYQCTYSDGTERKKWIGYDINTGILRGYPMVSDASEYMNLKFTAYDTKSGSYSYYKTLLVNVQPKRASVYKVLYLGKGRQYAYDFTKLLYDPDGDYLTFYLKNSADQTTLRSIGLDFYPTFNLLSGVPSTTGTYALYQLEATDPHGWTNYIYFTLIIKDYTVYRRTAQQQYVDKVVTVGQPFYFTQNNVVFFDVGDDMALTLFASTLDDEALPSWLNFEPTSRGFYGTAPVVTTIKIQIRAMNQYSQDSESEAFTLTVIPNNNPKENVQFISDDIELYVNEWFETTLQIRLFIDIETNRNATIQIQGANGVALPSWVQFNQDNRTVFGQGLDPGIYRVDFIYQDDGGLKAYSNVKITVLDKTRINKNKIVWNYVLTMASITAFLLYMTYLMQYNIQVYLGYDRANIKEISMKHAQKRFENYKDIEILYHLPAHQQKEERIYASTQAQLKQNSVYTYDFKQYEEGIQELKKMKIID
eukprot:403333387